jgi:hypothetical protein
MKVRAYRDRAYHITLHVRSQLFMTMLTDKSSRALVAQALLINSLCAEKMIEY